MTEAPFMVGDVIMSRSPGFRENCGCYGTITRIEEDRAYYSYSPCVGCHELYKPPSKEYIIADYQYQDVDVQDSFLTWVQQTRREAGIHD